MRNKKTKIIIISVLILSLILTSVIVYCHFNCNSSKTVNAVSDDGYIKWVDFDVSDQAMKDTMNIDIQSQSEATKIDWISLLAYLGTKYGGDFSKYSKKDVDKVVSLLEEGETIQSITEEYADTYNYYYEAYSAVLSEFVGLYQTEKPCENEQNKTIYEQHYGLKAFSPIAASFPYNDYDDFGVSRSYGYKRVHLGHDMMCSTGTPVIAIESGVVEALGWNQYGGWRIGIRSFDGKRYYYYAHLRKDRPYHDDMYEGKVVNAGDVIGYVGHTGYSTTENVNNIDTSHLHVGLELIFDESQKDSDNEIWIDMYNITNFLKSNRSEVVRDPDTKEYNRKYAFNDTGVLN